MVNDPDFSQRDINADNIDPLQTTVKNKRKITSYIIPKSFAGKLFAILALIYFGFILLSSSSKVDEKPALKEAEIDYAVMSSALDAYFEKNGTYPPKLDELDLGESASSSHEGFSYSYMPKQTMPDSGNITFSTISIGPYCNYKIILQGTDPLGESNSRFDIPSSSIITDRCNDDRVKKSLNEATINSVKIRNEATSEFLLIFKALDDYYIANNTYPILLTDLPLSLDIVTSSDPETEYAYFPGSKTGSTRTKDQLPACKYVLTLSGPLVGQQVNSRGSCD